MNLFSNKVQLDQSANNAPDKRGLIDYYNWSPQQLNSRYSKFVQGVNLDTLNKSNLLNKQNSITSNLPKIESSSLSNERITNNVSNKVANNVGNNESTTQMLLRLFKQTDTNNKKISNKLNTKANNSKLTLEDIFNPSSKSIKDNLNSSNIRFIDNTSRVLGTVNTNTSLNRDPNSTQEIISNKDKDSIPLLSTTVNSRNGKIKKYIFLTKVGSGTFNNPTNENQCGDIYKLNNLPATAYSINVKSGDNIEFNQDDITNQRSLSNGINNPLFITRDLKNPFFNKPTASTQFLLNGYKVNFDNYTNMKNFIRANKRSVLFKPTKPGKYYIASYRCGTSMGTHINVS
jgi:hypothetical protein